MKKRTIAIFVAFCIVGLFASNAEARHHGGYYGDRHRDDGLRGWERALLITDVALNLYNTINPNKTVYVQQAPTMTYQPTGYVPTPMISPSSPFTIYQPAQTYVAPTYVYPGNTYMYRSPSYIVPPPPPRPLYPIHMPPRRLPPPPGGYHGRPGRPQGRW